MTQLNMHHIKCRRSAPFPTNMQDEKAGGGGDRRWKVWGLSMHRFHVDNPPIWRTISAILLLTLATGCAGGGRSQWDYYSPEHVQCADIQIKLCRQYGPHLICGCRKK